MSGELPVEDWLKFKFSELDITLVLCFERAGETPTLVVEPILEIPGTGPDCYLAGRISACY